LLAKTAEERYQTAGGLEADLQRCLTEWEGQGHIKPFSLGTTDVPNRLLIPEKLYGREREVNTLITAFDRVVAHGTPELVLISGYSGIGKSSVLNELHKALLPLRGFFASGKFDQYKRDIPYATMAQAFQTLVRQILLKSEAEVQLYWDSRSDLTFSLWRERAECELLTGNFDMAEQLTVELLQRSKSKVDKAAVYNLAVRLHEVKGEFSQAVACGLECLNLFGIDIPAHPTQEQLQTEYETVWQALNGRSIESLMDLPLMTDPEVQAATPVLRPEQIPASPTSTIRTLVGQLDVETVVKASQALSSEIVLAGLIHRKSR
jgi:predicted ATPase